VPPRPDGKAARVERVTFTRPAADRIAKAVRAVEADAASSQGPTLGVRLEGLAGKVFRICTFTGAWSINSSKTVTFKYQTSTPNTVVATNLFWPVPDGPTRDCSIAKDGTAWFLLVPQLYLANAATAATITTTAIRFDTLPVVALATSGTAEFSLSITTCSTAAS